MITSGVEKLNVGTMAFCILVLSVVYYFFGDSVKTSVKFIVTQMLAPILSYGEASVTEKTIFQGSFSNKSGQRSTVSVPTYQTVLEYSFNLNGNRITTYDADILYHEFDPQSMIKRITSRLGSGPVTIRLVNSSFDREWIPWFIREEPFDQKKYGDTGFLALIKEGSFHKQEKLIPIHYLSIAPHFNNLESFPPGLRLFLGQLERFAAVLMAAAMLGLLWNMAYKDFFSASRLTGYLVWLLVLGFIFLFVPVRSLPTILKNRKYATTFTIDETTLKQVQLPN